MEETVTRLTAEFLKAMAHPVRIKVLKLLAEKEQCVCDLVQAINIEQSNLSQHLSVLKKQGMIESRKDGTRVIYRLVYPAAVEIVDAVGRVLRAQISQRHSLLEHL